VKENGIVFDADTKGRFFSDLMTIVRASELSEDRWRSPRSFLPGAGPPIDAVQPREGLPLAVRAYATGSSEGSMGSTFDDLWRYFHVC
jgi:hypothetical protein